MLRYVKSSNAFLRSRELRCAGPAPVRRVMLAAGLAAAAGMMASDARIWSGFDLRILALGGLLVTLITTILQMARTRVETVILRGGGGWTLRLASGAILDAKLEHWWLAAGWAGLAWRSTDDGRAYSTLIRCAGSGSDDWRHLCVRLRVPAEHRVE